MNASLIKFAQDIRRSYWFLPALMAIAAIALSFATTHADSAYGANWLKSHSWLYFNQVDGARATLSAIASSMITVAGVTFSMTIVAVSFASAHFGPRLIGNFMRDRGNQVTLGTFIATFVYSLLVLRSVRGAGEGSGSDVLSAFVPQLSVLTAIVLALASVAVLIYFIHHVPETINIGNITARLGRELRDSVKTVFPEEIAADAADKTQDPEAMSGDFVPVRAHTDGYLQAIDQKALLKIACDHDVVVRIQYRPGDFIVKGAVLAEVYHASKKSSELESEFRSCFASGAERTATQDTLFLVDQLVEILVRALSPGVNDPFTASTCMDWLYTGLSELVRRELPEPAIYDEDRNLRVVAWPISFERFASHVFDQSRQYVATDTNAALRMLAVLGELALESRTPEQRRVFQEHAASLAEACQEMLPAEPSRRRVAERYGELQRLLTDDVEEAMRDSQSWLGGRS